MVYVRPKRMLRPWLRVLAGTALVGFVVFVLVVVPSLLTRHPHNGLTAAEELKARNDVRTTLVQALAGLAVAGGLIVTYRTYRQNRAEQDRTYERELYAKAVEQLGHDKAPVRLGALYSLERLAQDKPERRQIIVDVICAYLRMPFSPAASKPESGATEEPGEPDAEAEARIDGIGETWQQERQVRLTAQRILAEHLRDGGVKDRRSTDSLSPCFWPDIRLDLVGATLIDFNLDNGVVADADFHGATFSGVARFIGAEFKGRAVFRDASFKSRAIFEKSAFKGHAWFNSASFSDEASFHGAAFDGFAAFDKAAFSGTAVFETATFNNHAIFEEAVFTGNAEFGMATFSLSASFKWATFGDRTDFERAVISGAGFEWTTFGDLTLFIEATFNDDAGFEGATFSNIAIFREATFNSDAMFGRATFKGAAVFEEATFNSDAVFWGATFKDNALFKEVNFSGSAWFDGAAFDGFAAFDKAAFSGTAVFEKAVFSGSAIPFLDGRSSLSFERSRVMSRDAEHVWPAGWCLGPNGSGRYTVVCANDDASQPIPGEGSDGSSPKDS